MHDGHIPTWGTSTTRQMTTRQVCAVDLRLAGQLHSPCASALAVIAAGFPDQATGVSEKVFIAASWSSRHKVPVAATFGLTTIAQTDNR